MIYTAFLILFYGVGKFLPLTRAINYILFFHLTLILVITISERC